MYALYREKQIKRLGRLDRSEQTEVMKLVENYNQMFIIAHHIPTLFFIEISDDFK